MVPDVPKSPVVAGKVVSAGRRALMLGIVSYGVRFSLRDRYTFDIIVCREGIFGIMTVEYGCAVGLPYAEYSSVQPILVLGVVVPTLLPASVLAQLPRMK